MIHIRVSRLARQDLNEVWSYIAEESVTAADRTLQEIMSASERLMDYPLMGVARPELAHDLRMIVCGSYLVFYRPSPERIEIIRVLHGRRDQHADLF